MKSLFNLILKLISWLLKKIVSINSNIRNYIKNNKNITFFAFFSMLGAIIYKVVYILYTKYLIKKIKYLNYNCWQY